MGEAAGSAHVSEKMAPPSNTLMLRIRRTETKGGRRALDQCSHHCSIFFLPASTSHTPRASVRRQRHPVSTWMTEGRSRMNGVRSDRQDHDQIRVRKMIRSEIGCRADHQSSQQTIIETRFLINLIRDSMIADRITCIGHENKKDHGNPITDRWSLRT